MDKRSFLKNTLFLGAGMPVFLKNLDGWVSELEDLSPEEAAQNEDFRMRW